MDVYCEVGLPDEHPLIVSLNEMVKWVKSSDVLSLIRGRLVNDNDLSDERLCDKIENNIGCLGDSHTARFDFRKDFDFSDMARLSAQVFEDVTGVTEYDLRHVAKTWYPSNGYIGWHTDGQGWRMYSTYAEGKSFFRYRHPKTKEIVTSWDKLGWTFRIFYTDDEAPVWHCVGAEDTRISIGYKFEIHN